MAKVELRQACSLGPLGPFSSRCIEILCAPRRERSAAQVCQEAHPVKQLVPPWTGHAGTPETHTLDCLVLPWHIRRTTPEDCSVVASHRYPDVPCSDDGVRHYADWVADAMEREVYLGWLAEVEGKVVAGLGITFLEWGPTRTDPQPLRARVVNVFTQPACRRNGISSQLLQEALREVQRRGIRTLSLGTTDQARALYARYGFQPYTAEMIRRG